MIVAYNSMKHLSKHHEIDFVCLQPEKGLVDPAEFVERLVLIPHRQPPRFALWMRYLRNMIAGAPPLVSAFVSSAMREKVKELIEFGKYDAILLFEMYAIQYCPPSCYSKLIVHIEDPQSIKLSRLMKLSGISLRQRVKLFFVTRLTIRYEKKILPMMAKVLLLSESDMNDMHKQGGYDNLACVSYGVDQNGPEEIVGYEGRERIIVFSGNMFHLPNVDGALFFLKDIFPLILQKYQSAILCIVGANPDNRIYDAAAKFGKQVVITGKVDDVAHYIKIATVSICPVRLKIGVQTKILEALSLGTPVVTTSAGNNGVAGLSGCHLWIEDDPHQFAKRVMELLQGIGWSNLSKEGRKFVVEHFSWEGSVAQLEQHLESLISKD
ncbi:MAG: glycosyltransferase [Thermodesulfobacteriota bacterium]